jgi:hypothetical protein
MMTTMFGFFCCAKAAGAKANPRNVKVVARTRLSLAIHFIKVPLFFAR